jgi:hypothetical protein
MKYKVFAVIAVLAMIFAMAGAQPTQAAAYGAAFTTAVTYQNVGTGPAVITISFYPEAGATPISIPVPDLAQNAGASIYIGSISQLTPGFKGSAVISSSQPLVATMVQSYAAGTGVVVRPLSNGSPAGAASVLVPTLNKNMYGYTSIVSIQNVDSVGADLTVEFVPLTGTSWTVSVTNLPAGAAKYYDMGKFTDTHLGASFTGSMRVTAKKTGTQTDGAIIASSLEAGTSANLAYSFEGATQTGSTLYMPSAFCKYTAANYTSTYAVQNTGTNPVSVHVVWSNGNSEDYTNIAGGAKVSIPGCGTTVANAAGFIGSATLTSTGGNIVGMAKISNNQGLLTAFLGFVDSSNKIAAPFVRWTETHWADKTRSRSVLAIQNIGSANLNAGDVVVTYYDKNGNKVAEQPMPAIAAGGKTNSDPKTAGAGTEFGYYSDGSAGGGAIITGPAGSKLAVIVRVSTSTGGSNLVGEDYNGIPIQ